MLDISQILHEEPKSDNWTQNIGASLRVGATRCKQLTAFAKDHFCASQIEFSLVYHKLAAQHLHAMNDWYSETYRILHTQDEYNLLDLQAFLDSAQGKLLLLVLYFLFHFLFKPAFISYFVFINNYFCCFCKIEFPAKPLMHEELSEMIRNSWELNEMILSTLQRENVDNQVLEEINAKIEDLGVTLPAEPKLAAASARVIFIQACELAQGEGETRIQSDVVVGLVAQAQELLQIGVARDEEGVTGRSAKHANGSSADSRGVNKGGEAAEEEGDVSSTLFSSLGEQIQVLVAQLQALLDEAATVTGPLNLAVDAEVDLTALDRLRGLKIITAEEQLLEFVRVSFQNVCVFFFSVKLRYFPYF